MGTFANTAQVYAQGTDPGAVGAGKQWNDTTNNKQYIRNSTNTDWIELVNENNGVFASDVQFAPTDYVIADSAWTTPTTVTASSTGTGTRNIQDSDMTRTGDGTTQGSMAQTYDGNTVPDSYYRIQYISATGTGILKLDFGSVAARNFTTALGCAIGSGGVGTVNLERSDDDSAWTTIVSHNTNIGSTTQLVNATFRYLRLKVNCTTGTGNGFGGWIAEWDNAAIPQITETFSASKAKDDKANPTTLRQKTTSEVAPWIKADMNSAQELLGIALHFHADTDITSFKIETSADDSTYARRKTVPYTLITEGSWNLILFPRSITTVRYVKVTGLDAGAKTISVNEIAVLILTESVINRRGRLVDYADPTVACETLTGA